MAKLIRTSREIKKLTQKDLANFLGFSEQLISNWENAKQALPLKHITKMSEILGIEKDQIKKAYLMDFEEVLNSDFLSAVNEVIELV